jgi:hypothetical protein
MKAANKTKLLSTLFSPPPPPHPNKNFPLLLFLRPCLLPSTRLFVGLAYQGKDLVFRFIIEYSSLRDFGP